MSAKNHENWLTADQVIANINRVTFLLDHSLLLHSSQCILHVLIYWTVTCKCFTVARSQAYEQRHYIQQIIRNFLVVLYSN